MITAQVPDDIYAHPPAISLRISSRDCSLHVTYVFSLPQPRGFISVMMGGGTPLRWVSLLDEAQKNLCFFDGPINWLRVTAKGVFLEKKKKKVLL